MARLWNVQWQGKWPTSVLAVFAVSAFAIAGAFAGPRAKLVSLDGLSPLAGRDEIARRLLSPLARLEYDRYIAEHDVEVIDQTIRTGDERLEVFVPDDGDARDYSLLVFVPPMDRFRVPSDWRAVLAREHMIMVSPQLAGNDQNMLGRRVPLALHAYGFAIRHYRVDPDKVYIAGFSGGGRTAQLIAFAYPDIFRGVMMIAGSDPFTQGAVPPPPEDLMKLVQTRLRIVQSTGDADEVNIAIDGRMRRSMEMLCIPRIADFRTPRLGHALPPGAAFAKALDALQMPVEPDPGFEDCSRRIRAGIAAGLAEVDALIASGRTREARKALLRIDLQYGGLAAPGSVERMRMIEARESGAIDAGKRH